MAKKSGIVLLLFVLMSFCVFDAAFSQFGMEGFDRQIETGAEWEGIDFDELMILESLYNESMTSIGRAYSGWFTDGNRYPCTWRGITCEDGSVTGLTFSDAGYFNVFPEAILSLHRLKELHMVNTLVTGVLPDNLFESLPELQILDLKGNLLSGSIPSIPYSVGYHPLRAMVISDNLVTEEKQNVAYNPEYVEVATYFVNSITYSANPLNPGIEGVIPDNIDFFTDLTWIDLSGNRLTGSLPDSLAFLVMSRLDVHDNATALQISPELLEYWVSLGNSNINLDGIILANPIQNYTEDSIIATLIPGYEGENKGEYGEDPGKSITVEGVPEYNPTDGIFF